MAPHATAAAQPLSTNEATGVLYECDAETIDGGLAKNIEHVEKSEKPKITLVWRNIILFTYLHIAALYGAWLLLTAAKWRTGIFAMLLYFISGIGITAGVHRLWTHRAYKAKWPLRVILMIFFTMAFQDAAIHWARDHRVHHKYSDTDADPHNAKRGFFFSHIGWLLCKKHPEVIAKGKQIDISDLKADPILRFQQKYYMILMPLACFILPTVIPVYCWGETWTNSWFIAAMFRWTFSLNATWLINSAAHKYGNKPYDKHIAPVENAVIAAFVLGEGWHNYHHAFPWDYKTSELGNYSLNVSTAVIDFFAKIGWAYDLKAVSPDIIQKRVHRTGDGSHPVWGWGDKDQSKEDIDYAIRINRRDG